MYSSSRGNALFLILIAVALFAALSYAVTQSGRSGGSIDKEQAQIDAANIISYAGQIEQAVKKLKLISGCSDEALNFASANWSLPAEYSNALAPGDGSCDVFSSSGAGLIWQKPPSSSPSSEYLITGNITVYGIGQTVSDTDADSKELLLTVSTTRDMCLALNNDLNIPNPSGNPPAWTIGDGALLPEWLNIYDIGFDGSYIDNNCLGCVNRAPEVAGEYSGCVYCPSGASLDCPSSDQYLFFHVLLAR